MIHLIIRIDFFFVWKYSSLERFIVDVVAAVTDDDDGMIEGAKKSFFFHSYARYIIGIEVVSDMWQGDGGF